ncbi:TlpA family protein disulfide reductase [Sphingobacterium humi]|uniref:Redoxin domain-containing protein n=1 Tax=Sphingobacterium humi TaxID=1796905 RepID=A0A6N8L5S6_9SPHI|nr:TlpA disulfide reductase family protein [Sphingobacterium humi]MVZ63801.1 redoxin domain-containing protein [Sphingobacterium humi]
MEKFTQFNIPMNLLPFPSLIDSYKFKIGQNFILAIFTICFSLFSCVKAWSQIGTGALHQKVVPLNVGEFLPEELWNVPLSVISNPKGISKSQLSSHRGKLIILDFWATTCTSCIKSLRKFRSVQSSREFSIIPISWEKAESIEAFFKRQFTPNEPIYSVYQDELLKQYFPYNLVPHYVWIDQDGKVVNFTSSISEESIQKYLVNKSISEPTKIDIKRGVPLFLREELLGTNYPESFQLFRRGTYHGLPSGTQITQHETPRILLTNVDVIRMYRVIAGSYARQVLKDSTFQSSRFIVKFVPSAIDLEYHNLDIILPSEKSAILFEYALNYLNEFSRYHGEFIKNDKNELTYILTLKNDLPHGKP